MSSAVEQFERSFAEQFGFAGAVATGFGRSAIALAMRAWSLPRREVLLPDFACAQLVEAATQENSPRYFAVAADLHVDSREFLVSMTAQTGAAVLVHYYGRKLPFVHALASLCKERGVKLLEDCALAIGVPGAGHAGDAAVFSLTKSDWCYGGGVLASQDEEFLREARNAREKSCQDQTWRAWRYGLLRRADFDANRPSRARRAELRGRWLDRILGFGCDNFFDAGSFDARMSDAAARRGLRILKNWNVTCARRKEIASQLRAALRDTGALFTAAQDGEESGEFLLLRAPAGRAHDWAEGAARDGVTLRLSWPAYQQFPGLDARSAARHLAGELLILEIHPQLTDEEIGQIAACLQNLSKKQVAT